MAIAPMTMRRLMKNSAQTKAARNGNWAWFVYPHSHTGINPAYNNMPVEERDIDKDFKPGDNPPLAHRNVRKFPDWYKPYTFNYTSDGYLGLAFVVFALFGYSYMSDIAEQKGRRSRKIFKSELKTPYEAMS